MAARRLKDRHIKAGVAYATILTLQDGSENADTWVSIEVRDEADGRYYRILLSQPQARSLRASLAVVERRPAFQKVNPGRVS